MVWSNDVVSLPVQTMKTYRVRGHDHTYDLDVTSGAGQFYPPARGSGHVIAMRQDQSPDRRLFHHRTFADLRSYFHVVRATYRGCRVTAISVRASSTGGSRGVRCDGAGRVSGPTCRTPVEADTFVPAVRISRRPSKRTHAVVHSRAHR